LQVIRQTLVADAEVPAQEGDEDVTHLWVGVRKSDSVS
jgi:hypothetical protein